MNRKKIVSVVLPCAVLVLTLSVISAQERQENGAVKIGVAVYDTSDSEVKMFQDYYLNYIQNSFPVEFTYSESLTTFEEEDAFIREMSKAGIGGIISFTGNDLEKAVELCAANEMYYMRGSGTVAREEFDRVKGNEYFLGIIGPNEELEYQTGADMAEWFAESDGEGRNSYFVMTGGAAWGNAMHYERSAGMLDALASAYGYTYDRDIDEALSSQEILVLDCGDGRNVTLCPGYPQTGDAQANLKKAFSEQSCDVILGSLTLTDLMDLVEEQEIQSDKDIHVGVVDCFSSSTERLMHEKDSQGNPMLEYISGKYASMIGPAFAAMFNAIEGDADFMRPDGEAFSLIQGFWTARGTDEFDRMYVLTQSVQDNAYSAVDLLEIMPLYHPETDFETFKKLTESSDFESVKKRMESR